MPPTPCPFPKYSGGERVRSREGLRVALKVTVHVSTGRAPEPRAPWLPAWTTTQAPLTPGHPLPQDTCRAVGSWFRPAGRRVLQGSMGRRPTGPSQEERPELAGWTARVDSAPGGLAEERKEEAMDTTPTQSLGSGLMALMAKLPAWSGVKDHGHPTRTGYLPVPPLPTPNPC